MKNINKIKLAVKKHITDESLIEKDDVVIAAVSGGVDSIVMTHILNLLSADLEFSLIVASVNHRQRPTAIKDSDFVKQFAKTLHLDFYALEIPQKIAAKISSEDKLRERRYNLLSGLLEKTVADKLATGHHLNDLTENFIMRLIRGAGPAGLSGIPAVRGNIIRPIL